MAGPTQDLFDTYFRRADLDQDGRISGPEAVAFFQGANLPKPALAQIWAFVDQSQTGFLGRAEFYNALKLITVAQSKRQLTPDIVKAALYGHASAKIPAPQINLTSKPAPQSNAMVGSSVPQLSGTAPTASQGGAVRGPHVSVTAGMSEQIVSNQPNQFMKPPRATPPGTAVRPQQGGPSPGIPRAGTIAASNPPSPNISADWLGGKTDGLSGGVTSQVSNRGITAVAQSRPLTTSGLMQPTPPKAQDSTFLSNQMVASNSTSVVVSGNGVAANSLFKDVSSATSFQLKQDNPLPASSAGGVAFSSAGIQPTIRPGSLGSLQSQFSQQPVGTQHQQVQSTVRQNQQASFASTGAPVKPGNPASGQSQLQWPKMTQTDIQKYTKVFVEVDTDRDGKITGEQARNLFLSWRLPREVLKQVWDLSDQDNDSMLSLREFCIALYLMERFREGRPLPTVFPSSVVFNEAQLPVAGQHAPALGNANSVSALGFQQPRDMPAARPGAPASVVRPPSQVSGPLSDEETKTDKQKPRVPVLEKNLLDQLSKEEQDSLNSRLKDATEADKKVEELEKEILDSKEKIEFYRTKMQELILYKSRCDNRVNEVEARVSADKREVESLAKKYEEKYKQAGDVVSRLTLEEATFRDIQSKKMELFEGLVKMEQDGNADGFQARADQIQVGLEELVKALNERCKTYGLRAKPTALNELPFGWQPGIQGGAADWDEDWDKFEDEGFTFVKELTLDVQNVIAPPKTKSSSLGNKASSTGEDVHAITSPKDDGMIENQPGPVKMAPRDISVDAPTETEEGVQRSSPDSPGGKNTLESPTKKSQDFQSTNTFVADSSPFEDSPRAVETQSENGGAESVLSVDKTFDEPSWGAFDTHYDTDSVWDFNSSSAKDTENEKHGETESSFFGSDNWSLDPIKTETKSAFAFDSVPSTPIYNNAGNSPPADNIFQNKTAFGFADSVPSTPMYNNNFGNSPTRRFSDGLEDRSFDSFSRFDSFSMNDGGLFPPRESLSRFDSMRSSTVDSEYNFGGNFAPPDSLTRFDSFRSTRDSLDYNNNNNNEGGFPNSFTRFDSMRSTTQDYDFGGHGFSSSFDDNDPFGSSGPFKSSSQQENQTPRKDSSDNWRAF